MDAKTLKNGWYRITRNGVTTTEYDPKIAALILAVHEADRAVYADCIEDRNPDLAARLRKDADA